MPIRWRLALSYSIILLVILAVAGAALNFLLERYLVTAMDDNLSVNTGRVHGSIMPGQVTADPSVIHAKLPPINEFATPGTYIEVVDAAGKVVVKSDNLGQQDLPVDPGLIGQALGGAVDIRTVPAGDGNHVRIMASPLYLIDQLLVLEVAQSTRYIDDTLRQLRVALVLSIVIGLILAVISGSLVARSALSPVKRITRTARSIEAGTDLSRRVAYPGPQDEIGELAATFDSMIDRLDHAFSLQKQFVADASHELRSPLTVIRGNLDVLRRNPDDENRWQSLRAIETETDRMVAIVNDLLLLAELEAGQVGPEEKVNLKELVQDELDRLVPVAGKRELSAGRLEDLSTRGDARLLQQMLANLVTNAIKYTPDGGAVTVALYRDGDLARIEVADTGIGIAAEHLPHIFERFYRVDKARSRAAGGTGLGLAIVKSIAEQHGGGVAVSSEAGKGSTFTVRLRLA
jgi:heavy metal sensor kinase